jgi:isochorismate pyruvate lyase
VYTWAGKQSPYCEENWLIDLEANRGKQVKRPDECADINDIRAEIDRIDRQVISLIGERAQYVKAAAKFKTSTQQVRAQDRVTAMLAKRRQWAEEQDLAPDVIEKLYRDLVAYFVQREMEHWEKAS